MTHRITIEVDDPIDLGLAIIALQDSAATFRIQIECNVDRTVGPRTALAAELGDVRPALYRAVKDLVNAWMVAGPVPDFHERTKRAITGRWPYLARCLDALVAETRR